MGWSDNGKRKERGRPNWLTFGLFKRVDKGKICEFVGAN